MLYNLLDFPPDSPQVLTSNILTDAYEHRWNNISEDKDKPDDCIILRPIHRIIHRLHQLRDPIQRHSIQRKRLVRILKSALGCALKSNQIPVGCRVARGSVRKVPAKSVTAGRQLSTSLFLLNMYVDDVQP